MSTAKRPMVSFPNNRWCVVERRAKLSVASIRTEILRYQNIQGEFTMPGTPAPARDQTLFKVHSDGKHLLVGVGIFESVGPTLRHYGYQKPVPNRNTIEIFIAPWNDCLGWFQFCFNPDGSHQVLNHLPYHEVHSTAFQYLQCDRFEWQTDEDSPSSRLYWLFARFTVDSVFRHGPVCGFNIARHSAPIEESSTWNHSAAMGVQDATTFGRLCLRKPGQIESKPFPVLRPSRQQVKAFKFSVTYDIPDNIGCSNYYTPQRLDREFAIWKSWGIDRLYWIDYGPMSGWPSIWRMMQSYDQSKKARRNIALTRKYCDDMLPWAAKSARRLGLELIAVYKPFDLSFNSMWTKNDGFSCVKEIENRHVIAHPDVAAHMEFAMQTNPAWTRRAKFPITRLCFYSETPLAKFASKDVTLWVSTDNLHYERYQKPFRVVSGPVRRPHFRWTPAGKVAEQDDAGSRPAANWRIELSGLAVDAPFAVIEIRGKTFAMKHRRFAFGEAWGADGSEAPLSLATSGDRAKGFSFDKTWLGWANHTEPILDTYLWNGPELGMVFKEADREPLLEPTYEGARRIWLAHIQRILEAGVDGVEIRAIGQHNCVDSYLRFAFAEPVRAEFRRRHGREVQPIFEDYERIRHIRGDAYTRFMRDAKALAQSCGKKFSAHVEGGVEVPSYLDTRLQMQMVLDWERWIREGIVDEISLRGWTRYNPYVLRHLLPLARRHKVPVHIISMCLAGGIDLRAMEVCERYVMEACAAGFAGFSLYESDSLLRMNAEGVPMSVGCVEQAVRNARQALDCRC